jgi:hypothetical protein
MQRKRRLCDDSGRKISPCLLDLSCPDIAISQGDRWQEQLLSAVALARVTVSGPSNYWLFLMQGMHTLWIPVAPSCAVFLGYLRDSFNFWEDGPVSKTSHHIQNGSTYVAHFLPLGTVNSYCILIVPTFCYMIKLAWHVFCVHLYTCTHIYAWHMFLCIYMWTYKYI